MLAMMGLVPPPLIGSPLGSPLLDPGGEPGNLAPPPVAGLNAMNRSNNPLKNANYFNFK